jgi:hypothetical protein
MEDIKRIVSALGSLILAHHRRINAYSLLSQTTSHEEIKYLCERYINHSKQMLANLATWRAAYGGLAKSIDQSAANNIWHHVRLLLSLNPEKTMRSLCEQGDRDIAKMYEFTMPLMPTSAIGDLQLQMRALQKMMRALQEFSERKQVVGSWVTK